MRTTIPAREPVSHLDHVALYLEVTRRERWEAIAGFDRVLDKD